MKEKQSSPSKGQGRNYWNGYFYLSGVVAATPIGQKNTDCFGTMSAATKIRKKWLRAEARDRYHIRGKVNSTQEWNPQPTAILLFYLFFFRQLHCAGTKAFQTELRFRETLISMRSNSPNFIYNRWLDTFASQNSDGLFSKIERSNKYDYFKIIMCKTNFPSYSEIVRHEFTIPLLCKEKKE